MSLSIIRHVGDRRRWLLRAAGIYALIELWRFWSFCKLLRRLSVRFYRTPGNRKFLQWAKGALYAKKAPLSLDREVFARFAAEGDVPSCGYGGGAINWERVYSWWAWGSGCPFDAARDPGLHADLLVCTEACCESLGLEPPPSGADAPIVPAISPFGYGICDVRATFKPLPLRLMLRSVQMATRTALRSLGMHCVTEPMPEGDLVCWTDFPGRGSPWGKEGRPPVIFLHGLGMGVCTYLPMFLGKGSQEWRAGGVVIVELPCMTSAWADLEALPKAHHVADALGRLMRNKFGRDEFQFDIVCHSLSAYLAAIMCNEGSPCRPRRTVLLDPVCFAEGVEVCSRFPFRTSEECSEFAKHSVLLPAFLPMIARQVAGFMFRTFVCRDIFTQYTALRWNGTDGSGVIWWNDTANALVCLSDDDSFVPSSRVAAHCEAHFPHVEIYRMPGMDHGSFVIENEVRHALLTRITAYLSRP